MNQIFCAVLVSMFFFGAAATAEPVKSSKPVAPANKDSAQDAGADTDVGVQKTHSGQTGHHAMKCGGVKHPRATERNKQ